MLRRCATSAVHQHRTPTRVVFPPSLSRRCCPGRHVLRAVERADFGRTVPDGRCWVRPGRQHALHPRHRASQLQALLRSQRAGDTAAATAATRRTLVLCVSEAPQAMFYGCFVPERRTQILPLNRQSTTLTRRRKSRTFVGFLPRVMYGRPPLSQAILFLLSTSAPPLLTR